MDGIGVGGKKVCKVQSINSCRVEFIVHPIKRSTTNTQLNFIERVDLIDNTFHGTRKFDLLTSQQELPQGSNRIYGRLFQEFARF
jgi:hypothetical protein